MGKKVASKKKTSTKKKSSKKRETSSKSNPKNTNVEKVLIENFIGLQKVMTNFAMKFDNLSIQISKLLELFEISAKALAEKDIKLDRGKETTEETKVAEKLDNILDQNKIIARGLTLLHEKPEPMLPQQLMQRPLPPQRPPTTLQPSPTNQAMGGEYQKSMPIKNQEPLKPKSPKPVKKNENIL